MARHLRASGSTGQLGCSLSKDCFSSQCLLDLLAINDVLGQISRILAHAPEEGRLNFVKARKTEKVNAGHRGYASSMYGPAAHVENCAFYPSEVVPVSHGPDHRGGASGPEVKTSDN